MSSKEFERVEELEEYDNTTVDVCRQFEELMNNISTSKMELLAVNYQLCKARDLFLLHRKRMYLNEMLEKKPKKDRKQNKETLLLSDQLCHFLQKPIGTISNRTMVFDQICEYIKKNKIEKGTKIKLDSVLGQLFGQEDEIVTYFSIQKRISPHLCPLNKIDLKIDK